MAPPRFAAIFNPHGVLAKNMDLNSRKHKWMKMDATNKAKRNTVESKLIPLGTIL